MPSGTAILAEIIENQSTSVMKQKPTPPLKRVIENKCEGRHDDRPEADLRRLERRVAGILPFFAELPSVLDVRQGYLVITKNGAEVRAQRQGRHRFLTLKAGAGKSRLEEEQEIPPSVFDRLWPLMKGVRLKKDRYKIPYHGLTIELDVYRGKLKRTATGSLAVGLTSGQRALNPQPL